MIYIYIYIPGSLTKHCIVSAILRSVCTGGFFYFPRLLYSAIGLLCTSFLYDFYICGSFTSHRVEITTLTLLSLRSCVHPPCCSQPLGSWHIWSPSLAGSQDACSSWLVFIPPFIYPPFLRFFFNSSSLHIMDAAGSYVTLGVLARLAGFAYFAY